MEYYKTLTEEKREKLFSIMRKLYDEQLRYEIKSRVPYGMIPVGSAHFDELLKSVIIGNYLRSLNFGLEPNECLKNCYKMSRDCIDIHNAKSKDINWKRHEISGDSFADLINTRILCGIN